MPHPFFDVPIFPWKRAEAIAFHQALFNAITVAAKIDNLYRQAGGSRPLTMPQPADDLWQEVINNCVAGGLLKALCQRLAAQPEWATLEAPVSAVQNAIDLVDIKCLTGDRIFVDRKNLRDEIGKLCGEAASHGVLLVRGERKSGKTWTKYFIEDLARGLGADCVFLYEGLVADVDSVLLQLFAAVGKSEDKPTPLESETAFYGRACTKLQEAAKEKNIQLWIVVDDLGDADGASRLDKEIRAFFDQFALHMANPVFAKWFKLVLLDYPDGDVPTLWKDVWVEDRPIVAEADAVALSEFLDQWAARKNKKIVVSEAKKFVKDVLAAIDAATAAGAPVAPRMKRLNSELASALKKL